MSDSKEVEFNKIFYIRADMNQTIATGHVMRTLSIADAMKDLGARVVYVTADHEADDLLKKRGFEQLVLGSDWADKDGELNSLIESINADFYSHLDWTAETNDVPHLLIDSYQVTEHYLAALSECFHVSYMDDLNAFVYPVQQIICYANYAKNFNYADRYEAESTSFLLGPSYAPLRREFSACPLKNISDHIDSILLMSGGSNRFAIYEGLVDRLLDMGIGEITIICGIYDTGYEKLRNQYKEIPSIHIFKNLPNLKDYIDEADLVVSAGGSTLYELCATGTPAVSYSFADNQLDNVKSFDLDGLIPYAGDLRDGSITLSAIDFIRLLDDKEKRQAISLAMQQKVDGKGAMRLAQSLLK